MKRFMKLYTIEQKLFFRSGDIFIFSLCMPVVILMMIGLIAGNKVAGNTDMTYLQSAFASLTAVGICCSAFMSIPIVIVDYRDKKILKRLYCSPCSPARILTVDVLCSATMAILSAICVSVVACLFFGYRIKGNLLYFLGVWLLTMVSMFSIGLLVASLCRTVKSMSIATTILYFPMLLFSGATIPYELFPKGMQSVASMMPLGVGIRLMKSTSMGMQLDNMLGSIMVLLVITFVCLVISVKTFRWE